jgi:hypothetical protein
MENQDKFLPCFLVSERISAKGASNLGNKGIFWMCTSKTGSRFFINLDNFLFASLLYREEPPRNRDTEYTVVVKHT